MKLPPVLEHRRTELTILPMVNVVFLLLIFFMLVARIAATDNLGVSPPISHSGDTEYGRPVRIVVASDGRMLVNGDGADITMLITSVVRFLKMDPETHFQLKADAALDANGLIEIIEILRGAGVRKLNLLIERAR